MVVLVDANTASASEIVTAALQDHHRATVVGTHTFGKGVFQEEMPLSNGGALDITVGEYFTPNGRNLGGGGIKQGAGVTPEVAGGARGRYPAWAGSRPEYAGRKSQVNDVVTVVAVVEKRGRFWAAEPHFPSFRSGGDGTAVPGCSSHRARLQPGARSGGGTVSAGELVLVRLGAVVVAVEATAGRGSCGAIGRADVARDAIEALMLDRGLARGFEPEVSEAAERAREEGVARRCARSVRGAGATCAGWRR